MSWGVPAPIGLIVTLIVRLKVKTLPLPHTHLFRDLFDYLKHPDFSYLTNWYNKLFQHQKLNLTFKLNGVFGNMDVGHILAAPELRIPNGRILGGFGYRVSAVI